MTSSELTLTELHAAMEAAIGQAARRAWRELCPTWAAAESEVALMAAIATVLQRRPDLADAAVLAELGRLGLLTINTDGTVNVRVPPLPNPVPVTSSRFQ